MKIAALLAFAASIATAAFAANVWEPCTNGEPCVNSVCVRHSAYYAQCKPYTLGQGELCGQNDGTNVWYYGNCPWPQWCQPLGTDYRCK